MELGLGLSELLVFPLYIVAVLAIVLTIFYRIEVGVFFLIFFLPLQNILNRLSDLPFGKDINDFILIALLIKWVIDKLKSGENLFLKTPLNLPIFLFLIWTFIEVWWGAIYFGDSIDLSLANPRIVFWKNLIRMPLIFLIIVNNIKNINQKKIILLLMIIAILVLNRNFYNIAVYQDFSHYSNERKIGGFAQKLGGNALAVCLAMYIVVIISLFIHTRHLGIKLFLSLPIIGSSYCILFMFSRSGYFAAFVGCAVLGILKDRKLLLALVILVFAWQMLLPVAVKERLEMTKSEEGYDTTVEQRFEFWEFGMDVVSSSPILGAGIIAAYRFNITAEGHEGQVWHSFHNAYLEQAVETGLVGLAIYLWIFLLMIITGWRLYRAADDWFLKALGLGLMACVSACMAGNVAGGYWNYLAVAGYMYVLAGIVVQSVSEIEDEKDLSLQKNRDIMKKDKPRRLHSMQN